LPPPAAGSPTASAAPESASTSAGVNAAARAATSIRIGFAPGQGDLSPDGSTAIRQAVASAPRGDTTVYNVAAYAAGTGDDPSTARRLSLTRALAVRNALLADGVPSTRIFVRALGAQSGGGPADRVDLSVAGGEAGAEPASTTPNRSQ